MGLGRGSEFRVRSSNFVSNVNPEEEKLSASSQVCLLSAVQFQNLRASDRGTRRGACSSIKQPGAHLMFCQRRLFERSRQAGRPRDTVVCLNWGARLCHRAASRHGQMTVEWGHARRVLVAVQYRNSPGPNSRLKNAHQARLRRTFSTAAVDSVFCIL